MTAGTPSQAPTSAAPVPVKPPAKPTATPRPTASIVDDVHVSTLQRQNIDAAVAVVKKYESLVVDITTLKQPDIGQFATVVRGTSYDAVSKFAMQTITQGDVTFEGQTRVLGVTSQVVKGTGDGYSLKVTACVDVSGLKYRDKKTKQLVTKGYATGTYPDDFTLTHYPDGWFITDITSSFGKSC